MMKNRKAYEETEIETFLDVSSSYPFISYTCISQRNKQKQFQFDNCFYIFPISGFFQKIKHQLTAGISREDELFKQPTE